MAPLTNLNQLFPSATNPLINVSSDKTTYTLKNNITITSELSLLLANVPVEKNIIFDGDGHTVTYENNDIISTDF